MENQRGKIQFSIPIESFAMLLFGLKESLFPFLRKEFLSFMFHRGKLIK